MSDPIWNHIGQVAINQNSNVVDTAAVTIR
jgi:hypothetical protein